MLSRREYERELEHRLIEVGKEVKRLKQEVIDVELELSAEQHTTL
ncbi:MAG: hypothetical protein ACI8V0_000847 [Pseudohongiellaceae bacterium]|jgi:hypothetical protein